MTTTAQTADPSGYRHTSQLPTACTALQHGTWQAYKHHHCRCPEARRENTLRANQYRLRLIRTGPALLDGTGTRRRLQALLVIGWRLDDIANRLDVTRQRASQLATQDRRVTRTSAAAVARLYDQLCTDTGPSRQAGAYTRRGWHGPECWTDHTIDNPDAQPLDLTRRSHDDVDPVAVERTINGDRTLTLTIAERRQVIRTLHGRGLSDPQIAHTTGISDRTVLRIRHELGLSAARRAS